MTNGSTVVNFTELFTDIDVHDFDFFEITESNIDLGSSPNDDALDSIMTTEYYGDDLIANIDVIPGATYKLQLLSGNDGFVPYGWDVFIEGQFFDGFDVLESTGFNEGVVFTAEFTMGDDLLNLELLGEDLPALMGFTLELVDEGTGEVPLQTIDIGLDNVTGIENLTGSEFNDILGGDSNDNILIGLEGNDRFILDLNSGNDTISDFSDGDKLDLSLYETDFASVLGATSNNIDGYAEIALGELGGTAGDTITLIGVDMNDLTEANIIL